MIEDYKKDARQRMQKSIETLRHELAGIRTGRAHTGLLEHVTVDYYGYELPLSQAANVHVEDARTLAVQPWEKAMVPKIEKAILNANLGLNPVSAGSVIRVPMPPLTEERRKELVKVVRQEAENARIAVRNIRRDINSDLKSLRKQKEITEDDERAGEQAIQKITDESIAEIDRMLEDKEAALMEV
jgi:ribosome recycling factor